MPLIVFRLTAYIAGLCVGLWVLFTSRDALVPVGLAIGLAVLMDRPVSAMERRRVPRAVSILICVSILAAFIAGALLLLAPPAAEQVRMLSRLLPSYTRYLLTDGEQYITAELQKLAPQLDRLGISTDEIAKQVSGPVSQYIGQLAGGLANTITGLLASAIWFVICPIITVFTLVDMPRLRRWWVHVASPTRQTSLTTVVGILGGVWSGYLRGIGLTALLYGSTVGVLFYVLGVRFWLVLGMMAAALYIVPYIGSLTTMSVSAAVAFYTDAHTVLWIWDVPAYSWQYALVVVGACAVSNFVFDQVVTPRLAGGSAGLSPLASVLALVVGSQLMGIWGMLLAIPVTACIWAMITHVYPHLTLPSAVSPPVEETETAQTVEADDPSGQPDHESASDAITSNDSEPTAPA